MGVQSFKIVLTIYRTHWNICGLISLVPWTKTIHGSRLTTRSDTKPETIQYHLFWPKFSFAIKCLFFFFLIIIIPYEFKCKNLF